jgi:hypothetical protein
MIHFYQLRCFLRLCRCKFVLETVKQVCSYGSTLLFPPVVANMTKKTHDSHECVAMQCIWRVSKLPDKHSGNPKLVLREKVWLGTYHTSINAAVHHDFFKVVLAVEGCIFTSLDVPTCSMPAGKKKSQKLKLNFPIDELPDLMFKAVCFSQLWNKYKQDTERYIFRNCKPSEVRDLVKCLIDDHCFELRKHIARTDTVCIYYLLFHVVRHSVGLC